MQPAVSCGLNLPRNRSKNNAGNQQNHVGLVRENNEDALLVREPSLFAVADGMGGYAAGEIASRSTIKAFEAATHSLRHEQEEQNIRKVMLEAFDKANTHVFKMAVATKAIPVWEQR